MDLHIGQRLICLSDRITNGGTYPHEALPTVGGIYTVRGIVPREVYGYEEDGVYLEEIVNAERLYTTPRGKIRIELAFRVSRFRPVRGTSIDVFREMLAPVKVLEPA